MSLSIPLDGLGGEESSGSTAFRSSPLDEVMTRALESENGIAVEHKTKKEAEARRFSFYRRINYLREHGVTSFDRLIFTIYKGELHIKARAELQLKEL